MDKRWGPSRLRLSWRRSFYFIFIILSTLRLDFWLSTFSWLRRVGRAVWHGDVLSSRPRARSRADIYYHAARSVIVLNLRRVGRSGRQSTAPGLPPASARPRASIASQPVRQHVSPQVVERLLAEGTMTGSDLRRVA